MVVPTGHPIYGTSFVALEANWVISELGEVIDGISVPDHSFVAIVPVFSNYLATFDYLNFDHHYQLFQYSGPPMNLFVGSMNQFGSIYVDGRLFGSTIGWAGIPYSMHYHKISDVGIARVPRGTPDAWDVRVEFPLPAYIVRDPLIVQYDPYKWIGTEAIVAWATLDDALKSDYDELITAKDYIGLELVALPTSPKSGEIEFWLDVRGWVGGLQPVYRRNPCKGTFWFWAWTRREKRFHLFDDTRYQFFDGVIEPGGKVFAMGLFHVGSVGVRVTAERHKYPQTGDPLYIRTVTFNPAPFDVIEWFDVTVFGAGYFYRHKGSYVFEVNYGAVIPPCYTIEYYGSQILLSVYIATNVPSGSVLLHQSILAFPTHVQFHPESLSNMLSVFIDWLYYAANKDRFFLVSDYADPLTVTPEDYRSDDIAVCTVCDIRSYRPFGGTVVRETEDGWEVRFDYISLHGYRYDAVYLKRRDGAITFSGCDPLCIVPLSGGLRWLLPMLSAFDPDWCKMYGGDDVWDFVYPVFVEWQYDGFQILKKIEDPLPIYTNVPDNRVIDVERPHEFFYEDIFVLTNPLGSEIPVVLIGSTINREWNDPTGDFYIDVEADLPFTYKPVFVGSWKFPTPQYHENEPYNVMPYLKRKIERRFKREVYHAHFLSDVHIRVQTVVNREFVECVIAKPTMFDEHRTGRDPSLPGGGMYPKFWVIPAPADPRSINELRWHHPTIGHWCLVQFAGYDVRPADAIPIVIGRTMCDVSADQYSFPTPLRVNINPIVPLIAQPHVTYRFVRPFYEAEYLINSIAKFLDALATSFPDWDFPEQITDHEFTANPAGFHAAGSAQWSTIEIPGIAHPAPAPFINGGAKIIGLGSLYRWAKSEGLALPQWFERFIERNDENGDHFLAGKLKATIVYASYWPIQPYYLQLYVWNYVGTRPYTHFSLATNIYGVFNEISRFGTILWSAPLQDDYNWRGRRFNQYYSFVNHRARLLLPIRGWIEELPAGRMTRIPDVLESLALYGTTTYLDREAIFVKEIVTLGNTSVLLLPRHARYDALGLTVPYFTQDGGRCPLWMGEPIIGVDGIPYDDGRVVVYVYSVRGVYSFVLTPHGVENWTLEPVPKWYWKLLTGRSE